MIWLCWIPKPGWSSISLLVPFPRFLPRPGLQNFIHVPDHRSRLIFDLDSSVVTVFGRQENAAVGYNPRYRGKRSYNPLLCIEANSSYLWDTELRPRNPGTWDGSVELPATSFCHSPADR